MKKLFANSYFIMAMKIVIAMWLIYFLVDYIDSKKIFQNLESLNIFYLFAAILVIPINIWVQLKKWLVISKQVLNIHDSVVIRHSLYQGFVAGLITPFRAGEYIARNLPLKADPIKVALATLVDKLFNMFIILLLGAIALVYLLLKINEMILFFEFILILLVISAGLIVSFKKEYLYRILNSKLLQKTRLGKILKEYKIYPFSFYLVIFLFSLLHYFLTLLQYSLVLISLNSFDSLFNLIWFASLLLFGKTIIPPFTFGELGIREASSVYFSKYFLITKAMAFNSTILIFTINLLMPSIWGLLFLFKEKS